MRTYLRLPVVSAVVLVLASGCAATPDNPQLIAARQQFSAAK